MSKNELLSEALAAIRAAGFKPIVVRNKHLKVSWIDHRSRRRMLIVSFTPSSPHARARNRAMLRRLLVS
jgi:hypothetical protein